MIRLKGLICLGMCIMSTFTYAQTSKDEIKKMTNVNQLMKERYSLLDTEQETWLKNYKIKQEAKKDKAKRYLGEFEISFYCGCSKCNYPYGSNHPCADGTMPKTWHTIAVDPKVIPLGTKVEIKGFNYVFQAHDTGGAIKGKKIDIFLNDHNLCLKYGRLHKVKVYLAKEGEN